MTNDLEHAVFVACPRMLPVATNILAILREKYPGIHAHVIPIEYERFASGEYIAYIPESIRGLDVLLFHAFHPDPTTEFMKFLIASDAVELASPRRVRVVLPFMPYQRQDRKAKSREPITARHVWRLMAVTRSIVGGITLDLHCEQEQGFSEFPLDNFPGVRILASALMKRFKGDFNNVVLVSPDLGSTKRAERLRDRLIRLAGEQAVGMGIIDKRRPAPNIAEIKNYYGAPLDGKTAIIIDDMIDTGGTIINAGRYAKEKGAAGVIILATHGIFSESNGTSAEEKFAASGFEVIVTNSIPRDASYYIEHAKWLTVAPIEVAFAGVLEQAMQRGGSVSQQF